MSTVARTDEQRREFSKRAFRRIVPLLCLVYVVSFLDRTNIGFAKDRLQADLGISAAAYGLGAGLFFLTYALLEVPSNLVLRKVGARWWIARIMITWGLLSAATAFVRGEVSFYVLRLLLGAAEAGLFPGVILYFTYWFTRAERAKANGYFLLGASIANIVGSPLAGALLSIDGAGGLHGWQWLFLAEGAPAVVLAFVILRVLPDSPARASWVSAEEARDLQERLDAEAGPEPARHPVRQVLRDPQIVLAIVVYFCHQVAIYAVAYFLPGIIGRSGSLSPLQTGLLAMLPWLASGIGALVLPRLATTAARARLLIAIALLVMAGGFLVGLVAGPVLGLVGLCGSGFVFWCVNSTIFTFPSSRLAGAALAGGLAFVNSCGILGGFAGPYLMGLAENSTGDPASGLWIVVVLLVLAAALAMALRQGAARKADPARRESDLRK
ncbi:sugar phosphate permease [Amycolatopsis sulphurea]|uniref:Sugar phosphate permease n=1 Tax=Amycolatopsis sulphurea TaxID=76022 RepID=A0A2A9FET5_9PSEU|nr:MFS transporter [Amycolatopsis sulphurea]PFG49884.1 sugar phosphate permease [Amycolatopsis sulphurea]